MKGTKKQHLPEKICVRCGRPFSWRKKWARVWEEVLYCSDRCRQAKVPSRRNLSGKSVRSKQDL